MRKHTRKNCIAWYRYLGSCSAEDAGLCAFCSLDLLHLLLFCVFTLHGHLGQHTSHQLLQHISNHRTSSWEDLSRLFLLLICPAPVAVELRQNRPW